MDEGHSNQHGHEKWDEEETAGREEWEKEEEREE